MKRFSFRLENVLNYRRNLQKQAQRDLYRVKNEYIETEASITRMTEARRRIAKACSQKERSGIDVPSYQIIKLFLAKIDNDIAMAYDELERIAEKIKAKTAVLKTVVIKKKILETLKKTQHQSYLEHYERENQKILDELSITRRGQII